MRSGPISSSGPNTLVSTAAYDIPDDILFTLGDDSDIAVLLNSAGLASATELTGVFEGTSVKPTIAANSLIISNVTDNGDIIIAASDGGNSEACLFFDASTPDLYLYRVGGTWTAGTTTWTIPAVTLNGKLTGGADTSGIDVQIYGDITGAYLLWDASEELLTLEQGGTDTKILNLSSVTDVTTGLTTGTNVVDVATNDFGVFSKFAATTGGLLIQGLGENAAVTTNLSLESYGGQANTTKTTAGRSLIEVYAAQHNGSNALANIAANGNVFGVRARVGGADVAVWIADEDGDTWQNGRLTTGASPPVGYYYNRIGGTYTSDGASSLAAITYYEGRVTGADGDTTLLAGTYVNQTVTTQTVADQTIARVASLYLDEPNIVNNLSGTGVITVASTIYISGAPTEGSSNYSLYVSDGACDLGASCEANAYTVNGNAGADYGPGGVTSITVEKGIVTACS